MRWYYAVDKERIGPLDENEFQALVDDGTIQPDTLVWTEGMGKWQEYASVAGGQEESDVPPGSSRCSQCRNIFPDDDLIQYKDLLVCSGCKAVFFQKVREGVAVTSTIASEKYGSIEKGLAGDYDFVVSDVLREAWELTKGAKRHILGATMIMYLILLMFNLVVAQMGTAVVEMGFGAIVAFQIFSQLGMIAIMYPMYGGITVIGIRRSVNLPVDVSMAFKYFNKIVPLLIMYVVMMIFVMLGFLLLVIPGIYLSVAYMLALPLIVEKNLSAWQALEISRKAITHRWFKIFWLFFLAGLIMVLSMIPLGIGLIWTLPMMTLVLGILYRTIFGVEDISVE